MAGSVAIFDIHFPKRFSWFLKVLSYLPHRWYFLSDSSRDHEKDLIARRVLCRPPLSLLFHRFNAPDPRVQQVISFYGTLDRESLQQLPNIYHEDASFKDPFHEVRGLAAIHAIFNHLFHTLEATHFYHDQRLL
jgi:hypothetical protein